MTMAQRNGATVTPASDPVVEAGLANLRRLACEFGVLRRLCPAAGLGLLPHRTIQLLDRAVNDCILR